MQNLKIQYYLETNIPKDYLFRKILKKVDDQKKDTNIFSYNLVDYRKFKVSGDKIEIQRRPSHRNPHGATGEIHFEFSSTSNGTKVTCILNPLTKFRVYQFSLLAFFLFLMIPVGVFVTLNDHQIDNNLIVYLFIIIGWTVSAGILYLILLYNRTALYEYSKEVLNDLEIKGDSNWL